MIQFYGREGNKSLKCAMCTKFNSDQIRAIFITPICNTKLYVDSYKSLFSMFLLIYLCEKILTKAIEKDKNASRQRSIYLTEQPSK